MFSNKFLCQNCLKKAFGEESSNFKTILASMSVRDVSCWGCNEITDCFNLQQYSPNIQEKLRFRGILGNMQEAEDWSPEDWKSYAKKVKREKEARELYYMIKPVENLLLQKERWNSQDVEDFVIPILKKFAKALSELLDIAVKEWELTKGKESEVLSELEDDMYILSVVNGEILHHIEFCVFNWKMTQKSSRVKWEVFIEKLNGVQSPQEIIEKTSRSVPLLLDKKKWRGEDEEKIRLPIISKLSAAYFQIGDIEPLKKIWGKLLSEERGDESCEPQRWEMFLKEMIPNMEHHGEYDFVIQVVNENLFDFKKVVDSFIRIKVMDKVSGILSEQQRFKEVEEMWIKVLSEVENAISSGTLTVLKWIYTTKNLQRISLEMGRKIRFVVQPVNLEESRLAGFIDEMMRSFKRYEESFEPHPGEFKITLELF